MRTSKTLNKIRNGELVRMCSLGHCIPAFVKQAAHVGFDCIWLDLEHRYIDRKDVLHLLTLGHLADIDIMVRVPTLQKAELYRYLEDGATGLMIPHVSTPERAEMLVNSVKFPPIGDRGLDGAGMDADFLTGDSATFPDDANRETFLVLQIETPEAIENVEAIAAVPGVDALFVGPGDLGLRLRHQSTGWTMEEAIQRTADACARNGIAWGMPAGSRDEILRRREQGAQILPNGGDFRALEHMLQVYIEQFKDC